MSKAKGQSDNPEPVTDEDVMREMFDFFDKDNSGHITKEEFAQATRASGLNPSDKEILDFIEQQDKDNTGTVDFQEFVMFQKHYKSCHKNEHQEFMNAFKLFDKDNNGFIEFKELKKILIGFGQNLTDDEIDEMIGAVDKDSDGRINYEEFTEFILKPLS